jgi:anti-anti-sigma factor
VIDGRRGRVRAVGDLDRRAADQLRSSVEALRRSGHRYVLVDLEGLRFVDEQGLAALRSVMSDVEAEGGGLTVLHLPGGADEGPP